MQPSTTVTDVYVPSGVWRVRSTVVQKPSHFNVRSPTHKSNAGEQGSGFGAGVGSQGFGFLQSNLVIMIIAPKSIGAIISVYTGVVFKLVLSEYHGGKSARGMGFN